MEPLSSSHGTSLMDKTDLVALHAQKKVLDSSGTFPHVLPQLAKPCNVPVP